MFPLPVGQEVKIMGSAQTQHCEQRKTIIVRSTLETVCYGYFSVFEYVWVSTFNTRIRSSYFYQCGGGTLLKHKLCRPEQQPFVYKPIGSLQFKLCIHSSVHLKLLLKKTIPSRGKCQLVLCFLSFLKVIKQMVNKNWFLWFSF